MGIESFFRAETLARFDFSRAPGIVARVDGDAAPQGLDLAGWSRVQARYLDPAHARSPDEAEAAMRESVLAYGRLHRFDVPDLEARLGAAAFEQVEVRGPLKRRVFAFQGTRPHG